MDCSEYAVLYMQDFLLSFFVAEVALLYITTLSRTVGVSSLESDKISRTVQAS